MSELTTEQGPTMDTASLNGDIVLQPQEGDPANELAVLVDELLDGLTVKFSTVSAEIFAKMDEMSRRLDNLESSIVAQQAQQNQQAEGGQSSSTQPSRQSSHQSSQQTL
ncbi:hypothetical protein MMC19_005962 [Ptychographa xylographoides]|nr:hypothetical protein [Ptychographa xylographoides]